MTIKILSREHTALRIASGITVLVFLLLAASVTGPVLAGSGSGGGGTPPPPPDFFVSLGTDAGALLPGDTGFLVAGGFPTCPAFYGCNHNWEPRLLSHPEIGFSGYVGGTVGIAPLNGFTGTVTLELLNLPPGVTSQTATNVTLAANTVATPLKLQVASTAALGNFNVTLRATSGVLVHEGSFPISVVDSLRPPNPQVSVPFSVVGGGQYGARVEVSAPAPAGGLMANLSTSDPALATVPASVMIPAGATNATFTVSTSPVTARAFPSILAAISPNGWPGAGSMFVDPSAALSQVNLFPTSVVGGNSSAVTVSLSAAVAEPTVVSLSSSDTAVATVPASVTVPAGSSSASAPISTAQVTASTTVAISATFGGVTKTAFLGVTAAAPPPPPQGGTITVKLAQYDTARQTLQVEVTDSTGVSQTLTVFVASTNQVIGTLTGAGTFKGQFNWPVNPGTITLASSLGWSMTADVVAK